MRHVDEKKGASCVCNFPESRVVEGARISRSARGDHGRTNLLGLFGQGVVIDLLGLRVYAVVGDLIKLAGEICRMSMGGMSAMGEIRGQDLVVRLNCCEIDGHVRLRAAL